MNVGKILVDRCLVLTRPLRDCDHVALLLGRREVGAFNIAGSYLVGVANEGLGNGVTASDTKPYRRVILCVGFH